MPTHYHGTPREVAALNAYINLVRAAHSVGANVEGVFQEYDLTASQFGVLEVLYHLGPLCQREIAAKLLTTAGNMTMVLDNLEAKKLIERKRSIEDRRQFVVDLTSAGRKFIRDLMPAHVKAITERMSVLTLTEQKKLRELCRKLGLNAGPKSRS